MRVGGLSLGEAADLQISDLAERIRAIPADAGGAQTAPLRARLVDLLETFDRIGLG